MIGTSETHPLRIDEVTASAAGGRIGMTILPGRSSTHATNSGIVWQRDLDRDLETIKRANPDLMLTLNESHEFALLGVPMFVETVESSDIPWRHLPILDAGTPDASFERRWKIVGAEALAILTRGGFVLIHCRAGLGRTGMIAARLMVEMGMESEIAIKRVRAARAHTIETPAQEAHVRNVAARITTS